MMNALYAIVLALALAFSGPSVPDASAADTRHKPLYVSVILTDYEIVMTDTIAAGPVVFRVSNEGSTVHSLVVAGQGIIKELDRRLRPGQRASMDAELEPGEYSVYCPVDNHKMMGMRMTLRVE